MVVAFVEWSVTAVARSSATPTAARSSRAQETLAALETFRGNRGSPLAANAAPAKAGSRASGGSG
eukprot:8784796-Lingulodinium_polyedra.AAC.1